ncbi:MAG: hypothetical protein J2P54_20300 [Bradyrhizobiaceae bacterium]|nr:hypothetical protein [Bradyrhizobiaceae bacterium]
MAKSGIIFEAAPLATSDLDLLADRNRLVLAIDDKKREGILPTLRKADNSFALQGKLFRAVNDDSYFVEVIRPAMRDEIPAKNDLGGLTPAGIDGFNWLVNSPRFEATAIAEDGLPAWLSCIDPRAFALANSGCRTRQSRADKKATWHCSSYRCHASRRSLRNKIRRKGIECTASTIIRGVAGAC